MRDPDTVLVVDDAAIVRRVVCRALEVDRYPSLSAATGEEAIAAIEREEIGVVLLDLQLPDLHGSEVLRRVKAIRPDIEVIILTGHASVSTAVQAVESDAFAYLRKPAVPAQIVAIVQRALEKRRLALENMRLTEELRNANEELEAKVAERTAELAEAYDDLKKLDRMKDAFIDVSSHELRTPLSVIETVLTIVESRADAGDRSLAQATRLAGRATERLKALATRISGFSRIDADEDRLVLTQTTPLDLAESAAGDVAAFIESRGQTLRIEAPKDLPSVHVDSGKIRDVLLNLLMNAIRFTPDGGEIDLSVRRSRMESLVFRVTDTGIGIADEDRAHIFDEFFTSLETLRHSSGDSEFGTRGIGLGLAIVKKFVEMHGGEVGLESRRLKGSSFWFTLPLRKHENHVPPS
ncbi:MAG: hypothetical protein CME06_03825 [Gemmatimonadetes bacterium]|nr:hypothetical protein [Gemmatimonadota bacterium]